jgi:hypothetical protein
MKDAMDEDASCVRCGRKSTRGDLTMRGVCALPAENIAACRDRELANLRSLLRSVTGKLEELHAILLDDEYGPKSTPVMLIDSVLEVLS